MIAKCPKPAKDNEKWRRQVRFNDKGNCACNNGKNNDDHKIYASMSQMLSNDERKSVKYGDIYLLTNWILYLGAMCHMTPEVLDFIPGSLEYTDKYIEVADGHHVTAEKKGQVRIKMCDNNENKFVATLYNVLLAPDLCDRLFLIITIMNSGHTCPEFGNLKIENNLLHKSGAKSTLYNVAIESLSVIVAHLYSYSTFLFGCGVMSIRDFNLLIRIF